MMQANSTLPHTTASEIITDLSTNTFVIQCMKSVCILLHFTLIHSYVLVVIHVPY